jgi:hypothetical protein
MKRYACALVTLTALCCGAVGAGAAEDLPNPLTLQAPDLIPTPDGSGAHVGRVWAFTLNLSRQYTPNNQEITPYTLTYWYGNGNRNETWRGTETFTIDLLDSKGNTVVADVLGPLPLPRYRCWYGGGALQTVQNSIEFDYANKGITSMRINVGPVSGPLQTGC